MSFVEYAFAWLVDMTVGTAVVLATGAVAIAIASEPATRQRIGEFTLGAALFLSVLLALPGVSRFELGVVDLRSSNTIPHTLADSRTGGKIGRTFTSPHAVVDCGTFCYIRGGING